MDSLLDSGNEKSIHSMKNIPGVSRLKIQRTTVQHKSHSDRVLDH